MRGRRTVVRRLVIVTTVVGLLTGLIGLSVVSYLERSTLLDAAEDAELAAAERTASVVDGRVDGLLSSLALLSTRDQITGLAPEAAEELQVALRVLQLEQLTIHDRGGTPVAAAATDRLVGTDQIAPLQDLERLLTGPRVHVRTGDRTGTLELSVPIEAPPGTPVGVLTGRTDLTFIADEVSQLLSSGARTALVTADGTTIADRDADRVLEGHRQPVTELPPERPTGRISTPEGTAIIAAAPLRTLDGYVVVEQLESRVVGGADTGLRGPAGVLLLVVVAIVAAVILTGRRLLTPLGPLADAVGRLGAGERGVRVDERGTGEVADLARGFNVMAAALEDRRRELENAERGARMSEERLRLVVEGVQDYAIVLLDVLGDVRTWNTGARRVTGRDQAEIVGRRLTALADPSEPMNDPVADATRTGRGEAEGWFLRPDGTRFWGQLSVSALRRDDGAPYGYAAILQDVTERRAARQALEEALHREQEAAEELRRANQLKDEFLAVAAHEIRTPLSAILGATRLLRTGPGELSLEETEEVRELIWSHASDMRDIVERLLDFTQLQAGRVRLHPVELSLRRELERSVETLGRLLAEHEVVLDIDDTTVEIDPSLLRHVVTNLLSNAAKFSPPGSPIELAGRVVDGGTLRITVTDHGIGIAEADHERIFELFRQAEHQEPSARGTGVGLAIVRRYVDLVDGRVRVESQLGAGARFTVEVPVTVPPTAGTRNA